MGSFIGLQREHAHGPAGWRTHLIVTMASAMFVMAVKEVGGSVADMSRVIQGVAVGVGFIGAGAIFKSPADSHRSHNKGLTTAASVWLTAAVGIAVGAGSIWLPLVGSVMGWFTLGYLKQLEKRQDNQDPPRD